MACQTATIGGQPSETGEVAKSDQELDVSFGDLDLNFKVPVGSGGVQDNNGKPQLDIKRDKDVNLAGGGMLPGSTVQVWLPGTSEARELARIPVGEDGEFDGKVSLASSAASAPLPIGEQVIQLTGVDANGSQTVVSMTINIAQPDLTPELFRGQTTTPNPGFGNFIASKAGLDEVATLTGIEDRRQALIQGDNWQMGLTLTGQASQLTEDGGAVSVTLIKGERVDFTGSGFMPGTIASIWLFSEPKMLGEVSIGTDGSFDGVSIAIPEDLEVGQHTVQIQAVASDGFIRSANLGIALEEPASAAAGFWPLLGWLPFVLLGVVVLGIIFAIAISRRRGRRAFGSNVIQFPRAA